MISADAVQLQRDLLSLNSWSSEHFMKFNANKREHLVITKKRNYVLTSYNLNGSQNAVVSTEKDLGVHVSSNLSWNGHIDLIISKANKMLGVIYRTWANKCDQKALLILHKSLVRPQLEYSSQVWSPYTKEKNHGPRACSKTYHQIYLEMWSNVSRTFS